MKAVHCPIDTSLNFTQANKLIRDLKPEHLVIPEVYTQPPGMAPHRTDLVIESIGVDIRFLFNEKFLIFNLCLQFSVLYSFFTIFIKYVYVLKKKYIK